MCQISSYIITGKVKLSLRGCDILAVSASCTENREQAAEMSQRKCGLNNQQKIQRHQRRQRARLEKKKEEKKGKTIQIYEINYDE